PALIGIDWLILSLHKGLNADAYNFLAERVNNLLLAVRSIQNRLSPINCLPVEILAIIFTFLMPSYIDLQSNRLDVRLHEWHKPSLVCRYWRQISLATPGLWTDFVIPYDLSPEWTGPDSRAVSISAQLSRSGDCPLNVIFGDKAYTLSPPDSMTLPFAKDLLNYTHRIRYLRIRISGNNDDALLWTRNAAQLEVLELESRSSAEWTHTSFDLPLLSHADTPRIHTLVVSNCIRWQTGTFCTLRCLIFTTADDNSILAHVTGFMDVLTANSRALEDLIISNHKLRGHVEQRQIAEAKQTIGARTRTSMTALKRLKVESSVFIRIFEPKMVMKGCARIYNFDATALDAQSSFAVSHLSITKRYVIGTDGNEALCASQDGHLPTFIHSRNVQELWLHYVFPTLEWGDEWGSQYYIESSLLKEMPEIRKLVILGYEDQWLKLITRYNAFPALAELQLHCQTEAHYSAILDFARDRLQRGQPISTLRILHDPSDETGTFSLFEQNAHHFRCVVQHVLFEDILQDGRPPRMKLPEVCHTYYPLHESSSSQPWDDMMW
ncbi:hypothetical protein BDW22DRAFT_1355010, partial [Trametopsis cervina]